MCQKLQLLYFSPVPWASYAQRSHFMVLYLQSRLNCQVLWVDPSPSRLPAPRDFYRSKTIHSQGTPAVSGIEVVSPRGGPVEPLPGGSMFNSLFFWRAALKRIRSFCSAGRTVVGVGKPGALAVSVLDQVEASVSFFDAMDDFPQFHHGLSRKSLERLERQVVAQVDFVLTSSTGLEQKFSSFDTSVHKIFNGFDADRIEFSSGKIRDNSPVFGYLGSISDWLDWDFIIQLAACNPDSLFRFVGPILVRPPKLPVNVELLPACRHDQVMNYLGQFTVGLIPFRNNRLTAGVDPIKYYEYYAAGLPVISTCFGEMACRGSAPGVFLATAKSDLTQLSLAALNYIPEATRLHQWRLENCWSAKFAKLPSLIEAEA